MGYKRQFEYASKPCKTRSKFHFRIIRSNYRKYEGNRKMKAISSATSIEWEKSVPYHRLNQIRVNKSSLRTNQTQKSSKTYGTFEVDHGTGAKTILDNFERKKKPKYQSFYYHYQSSCSFYRHSDILKTRTQNFSIIGSSPCI